MSDERPKDRKKSGAQRLKSTTAKGKTDPTLRKLDKFVVEEIELTDTAPPRTVPTARKGPPRWWPALKLALGAIALALLPVIASLVTRSAWPGDETRFLAMAWEMWAGGDTLVPRLNGVPQPVAPLFFWVVHAGWAVFGAVEWWPRLVPALFMVGSLFLSARLALFLFWPGSAPLMQRLPLVLLGGFFWVASATLLTPDFVTVFFTLFALVTVAWMWRTRDMRVWLLLAPVLGFGMLASGSLILLYVLPVALLAPLWARGTITMPWKFWYLDIAKATLIAFAVFAAWLVPAAGRAGGVATLLPVLAAPLASHSLELYEGARPWWWVLALLPVLAFPWALWPLPWMRLWHIRRESISNGLLFCLWWALPAISVLAYFPGRQAQLLLPLVPAFFVVMGWLVLDERHEGHDHSRLASTMIFPLLLLGGLLAVLPGLPRVPVLPEFLWQLSPFVGVGIIAIGIAVGWLPIPALETRVTNMAATVVVLTTLVLLTLGWEFNANYETGGAARLIAEARQQGRAVGHVGRYAGQFHFSGRLTRPLEIVAPDQAADWLAANPDGLLVTYTDVWQPPGVAGARPFYEQPYGNAQLRVWQAAELIQRPAPAAEPLPPQL